MLRRAFGLVLAATMAFPPSGLAQQTPTPLAADLQAGIRQVDEGDLDAAVIILEAVVLRLKQARGAERDLATAYLYLSMGHLGLSQIEKAKAEMREAWRNNRQLALDPNQFPPRVIQLLEQTKQEDRQAEAPKPVAPPKTTQAPQQAVRPAEKKGGGRKEARAAKRYPKESTVDMSAMKAIFLGWVDLKPADWAVHGYSNQEEWDSAIGSINDSFSRLSQTKWLSGRTVTRAKGAKDESAAGQELYIKFSDIRIDYESYLLNLSIHFIDPKTNSEIASIPTRPYYGNDWGFEGYLKAALEDVNLKIQVEITGAARDK